MKIHGMGGRAPSIPVGYRLDESQPGVFALRHADGTLAAAFPSREALDVYLRELAEGPKRGRHGGKRAPSPEGPRAIS